MNDLINNLKTPEECMLLSKKYYELAHSAHRRAIELRANSHGFNSEVEMELLKVLYLYEDVLSEKNRRRTRASRTWQMIKRYGLIGAAERAVNRKIDAMGYKMLVNKGMNDLTFEAVILRFPESFSKEAVDHSRKRLEELSKI
jgi:hypothetical protein